MRLEIHVTPGASATGVGGSRGGALVVRVTQRRERGRATAAALEALADALGVPRAGVVLVRGGTSRRKLVDVTPRGRDEDAVALRVADLLRTGVAAGSDTVPDAGGRP